MGNLNEMVGGAATSEDDTGARAVRARRICPFLNTKQAAFHLGLSHRTLIRWRNHGQGPRARKHGVVYRYHIDDIEKWSLNRD